MNLQEYLDQRVSEPDASVFTNVKYDKQETTVRIGGRSCPQEQVWADLSATREKKKNVSVCLTMSLLLCPWPLNIKIQ